MAIGWERAELLALLCVMFSCVFVTLLFGVLGQVWYLIVLILDLCLLTSFPVFHYQSRHTLQLKYNIGLKTLQQGISEPVFYGD